MILNEIREKAKIKKANLINDVNANKADIRYADALINLFNNSNAIVEAPASVICTGLLFIGYDFKIVNKLYDELISELTKKYMVISPEQLKMAIIDKYSTKEHKK